MKADSHSICERLKHLRVQYYGERGRSQLCRELGITPSTYSLYEHSRVPPVQLLVQVAELTQTPLSWLLTGVGNDPLIAPVTMPRRESTSHHRKPISSPPHSSMADWIPIIGSTAAGTARYWEEIPSTHGGVEADALLEQRLAEYSKQVVDVPLQTPALPAKSDARRVVSLVQCSTPDNRGFLEFLNSPSVKQEYPRAVAWRIDGESMSPRYQDGDIVVCSLDHPAVSGHPCVARQKGQIGVNCKIYQESGRDVLLIPINERSRAQRTKRSQILWAYRVLSSVRITTPRLDVS